MTYRGNPALPPDTQQRILGTFEQTLSLAEDGNRQEALLGCDFILRMDPRFEPARHLQERLQGATGGVHVNDLRAGLAAPAPAVTVPVAEPPAELFEGFDLALPDLPPLDGPSLADLAALRLELTALLERRAFRELVETAERERAAVAGDADLQALVESAQARLEAEPYVARFVAGARQARQAGNREEADRLLAKARSLDPTHPDLAALAAPPPPPAGPPVPETPPRGVPLATDALLGGDDLFGALPGGAESESDRRIADLLADGQRAFDRGDPQGAIDAWSRIFLIDIDHEEAARRIDQARRLKAEGERQVEEVFHDGLSRLEAGDPAGARQAFERVLEMQPGHLTAREYLQQIEAGKSPLPPRPAPAAGAAAALPVEAARAGVERGAPEELKEEILVPPEPGEARPAERRERPAEAAARPGGLRRFVLVGGAVLVLVAAGGWFVFQNRSRLFPNSQEEPAAAPATAKDPIARAVELHQSGRTPMAIAQLRRLPPGDPHYRQAQALIQQWESPAPPPVAAPRMLAPEQAARREELLAAAREAAGRREYLGALDSLSRAAALQPLAGADAELQQQVKAGLQPLASQVEMFRQQDWEFLVPELWRLRESDPGNAVVTRLLVDSYHNMGVQALQQGDVRRAETHLSEALSLAPNDAETRRHYLFAQTYQQRPQDLLFRIYVKYLPFR
jgi:tetratricopeptide (TPR) repeat protein